MRFSLISHCVLSMRDALCPPRPPSYNMGVSFEDLPSDLTSKYEQEAQKPYDGFAFDWYQATFPVSPSTTGPEHSKAVIEALADELKPACVRHVDKGLHGYLGRTFFVDPRGGNTLMILHGGNPSPNVTASSHRSEQFAEVARRLFPAHNVTRVDVAMDFEEPGAWDRSVDICRAVMIDSNMNSGRMILPDCVQKGATYYMGSVKSPVSARLYQKGYEQLKRFPDCPVQPDWVRLELQIRPEKKAKEEFAHVSRDALWGASKWSAKVIEKFTGWAPSRINAAPKTESEWERTQRHLVHQYAGHMQEGAEMMWWPKRDEMMSSGATEDDILLAEIRLRKQCFEEYIHLLAKEVWLDLQGRNRNGA